MSDTTRVERLLLRAGRAGAPAGAKERSLAAVAGTLGSALVTSQAAAGGAIAGAGSVAGAAKAGSLTLLHVIAVTGLTGIGAVGSAVLLHHGDGAAAKAPVAVEALRTARPKSQMREEPRVPPPRPSVEPVVENPVEATPSEDAVRAREPARGTVTVATGVGAAVVEAPPSPVRVEITMLDEARRALGAGEPARALSILDAYVTRFPRGTMGPEATLVRIEALLKAGDRPAAERAADVLGASDPDNPYGARVRSLLAGSNH
ncbi:MAG TPA: tetratricopeptide repeat protein [Polyangiaceae bacterium]|nr:tetratricopeptide repeat protein [Polyangiaceae bacterium]